MGQSGLPVISLAASFVFEKNQMGIKPVLCVDAASAPLWYSLSATITARSLCFYLAGPADRLIA